jgi:hypothetical protein
MAIHIFFTTREGGDPRRVKNEGLACMLAFVYVCVFIFKHNPCLANMCSRADTRGWMFDDVLSALERELQAALTTTVAGLVATARTRFEAAVADIVEERAKGLAEVAKERAKGLAEIAEKGAKSLAEVDTRQGEIGREVAAMHKLKEEQEGRVELNIGGYRYETSVQTLRRVPHTFFDAYFSGRYAQDMCVDGSIFVDRDGEHFGHVLGFMRDGILAVAEPGALPSVSLLRALKREFGFYCMELCAEEAVGAVVPEIAYVIGGYGDGPRLSSMERYDASSGQWSTMASMRNMRSHFGACVLNGEIYVTGGTPDGMDSMIKVEKYCPTTDTWCAVAPLDMGVYSHAAVVVEHSIFVIGGVDSDGEALDYIFEFDSDEVTWYEMPTMPEKRRNAVACVVGSNIYVFGRGVGPNEVSDYVLMYDTETCGWSILAEIPLACSHCHASVLDGLVYIIGAGTGRQVLRYDPASGVFLSLAPTLNARRAGVSFMLGGCLHATGGEEYSSSVERYDVSTNMWTEVTHMLDGRSYARAVTIGSASPPEEQDLFDSLIAKASRRQP